MRGIIIKDCQIYEGNYLRRRDVLVVGKRIRKIARRITPRGERVIDAGGRLLAPGFIDAHSHWREPGFSNKETILTASKAAAKGGFTTAFLMPNLRPVPDSLTSLQEELRVIKRDSIIEALPYGSISKGLEGRELSEMAEMAGHVVGFSDDGRAIQDRGLMLGALRECKRLGLPLAAHCEDYGVSSGGHIGECKLADRLGIETISPLAESKQLARDIELVRESRGRYHLCHISNSLSLNLVKLAKREGLQISCEVTPHHLISSVEDITEDRGRWKMKPPLASRAEQLQLVKALRDGIIDIIATDHAPHLPSEKEGGIRESEFGIVGLEFAFPLLYTNLVLTRQVSLKKVLDALTSNVAKTFRLKRGRLEEGARSDLVLIDLNLKRVIEEGEMVSKGKSSPYVGREVYGIPVLTISGGKVVYEG